MKKRIDKKRIIKSKLSIYNELDAHNWATKTELWGRISGKPDLKLKKEPELFHPPARTI